MPCYGVLKELVPMGFKQNVWFEFETQTMSRRVFNICLAMDLNPMHCFGV